MKPKYLFLSSLMLILLGCSTLSITKSDVSDYKTLEKQTVRGFLSFGPLKDIPEETSKEVVEAIDSGECKPDQRVTTRVTSKTFMGFVFSKKGKFTCE